MKSLTKSARNCYRDLLDLCWIEGGLPIELATIAKMLPMAPKTFANLWQHQLSQFFDLREVEGQQRYFNKRLWKLLQEKKNYSQKMSSNAHTRWQPKHADALQAYGECNMEKEDISGKGGPGEKPRDPILDDLFETFWQAWQGDGSKPETKGHWDACVNDTQTAQLIIAAVIERNSHDARWQEGPRWIGSARNFLRGRKYNSRYPRIEDHATQPPAQPRGRRRNASPTYSEETEVTLS